MSVSLKGENVVWCCCTFAGKVTHVRGCRCVPGSGSGHPGPGRGEWEKNFKQTSLSPAAAAATYIRTIGGVIPYQPYLQSAGSSGGGGVHLHVSWEWI